MKTTIENIKNLTTEQLIARVQALESQLDKRAPLDGQDEESTPYDDAARLWFELERNMNYKRGYVDSYYDRHVTVIEDLALLGRIQQEVTLSHLMRNSGSDFVLKNNGGRELNDDQYSELFFFLDRLSSSLYHLKDLYIDLSREEAKKK
jgi:hypothetical protein